MNFPIKLNNKDWYFRIVSFYKGYKLITNIK